jgi:hypothetical protein
MIATMAIPTLPKKPARKRFTTKLTPEMIGVADRMFRNGGTVKTVAGALGVSVRTFNEWLEKGSVEGCPDELLVEFAATCESARAEAVNEGMASLKMHGQTDWKAQLEYLRALDPDTFSPQTRSKVDIKVEAKRTIDYSKLSDTELERLAQIEEEARLLLAKGQG